MADKSYYKYLKESHFDVTDTSNQDSFNDPNSPILNLYTNGDGFSIHDNSALYEVIKIFKDTVDRQPTYFQSYEYGIDVNNKRMVFRLVTANDHIVVIETVERLIEIIKEQISMLYGDTFDIYIEEKKDLMGTPATDVGVADSSGKISVVVVVSEKKKEEPKTNIE